MFHSTMPERTTKIELTPDELKQEREAAATKGARKILEEMQDEIERLRADLKQAAMSRDLIPEGVLLKWLDVSRKTLRYEWEVPHDSQKGHTRFYDWETVESHLRSGDEEQQQAVERAP